MNGGKALLSRNRSVPSKVAPAGSCAVATSRCSGEGLTRVQDRNGERLVRTPAGWKAFEARLRDTTQGLEGEGALRERLAE
jgi:phosphoglucomutase